MGRDDFRRCVVFHSLSKRSNLPGLRSGFVAGDADILQAFLLYRTYHGCAMPLPCRPPAIAAWQDEAHVRANRDAYREKFAAVLEILQPVLPVNARRPASTSGPRYRAATRTSPASCSPANMSPCCRAAILSREGRANPAPTMCAWPWWRRWKTASRPRAASAEFVETRTG
jgi:hypothetical protein